MLQSKIFGKTLKEVPKDEVSKNSVYLIRAGYINKVMAGVYNFLPLGLRVLNKIENIIRDEMNKIATEILMPSIVPKLYWEKTERINTVDVLMKAVPANKLSLLKNSNEYILNSTHEEVVTPLVKNFCLSYKDLPIAVYQIQTKFRNEPRAKSGLLRCREFRMKDLYSFHRSEKELMEFYEKCKNSYFNIFNKLGLGNDTKIVLASGGDFTKENSHEFQTKCESGEDIIFYANSINTAYNKEIAPSKLAKNNLNEELKKREDIFGEGIIGVDELTKFLNLPIEKTTKTILFEADENRIIAVTLRGDYEINELKLKKIANTKNLNLATNETVQKITGAELGYAGLLNLPKFVEVFIDDSIECLVNFEMGTNKTNYHSINVNFGIDIPKPNCFYDLKIAKDGDLHPQTNEVYEVYKASEVGNIFPLNTKFTKSWDYNYTNQNSIPEPVYMGSYGIGPSRIMGVLVEKFHDEKGIIWPEEVSPYKIHLLALGKEENVLQVANELYKKLINKGVEVLFDDRDVSPGIKLSDCDLIGITYRVVVSKRSLQNNCVELKKRCDKNEEILLIDDVVNKF